MGKSASKYLFENVSKGIPNDLSSGVFIWMLNAHKRPPHFVISINGLIYGISLKGPSIAKDIEIYKNLVLTKSIPTIFIKLNDLNYDKLMQQDLVNHIHKNPLVKTDGLTCLDPICFFLEKATGNDLSQVERIFDLLDIIADSHVESYHSYNLPVLNKQLLLDKYTREDIITGIQKVQRKYAIIRE